MNVKEIKTLVGIMEDSSLTALEIEVPDLKLRLSAAPEPAAWRRCFSRRYIPCLRPHRPRRRKPFRRRLPRLSSLPPQSRRPRPGRTLSIRDQSAYGRRILYLLRTGGGALRDKGHSGEKKAMWCALSRP